MMYFDLFLKTNLTHKHSETYIFVCRYIGKCGNAQARLLKRTCSLRLEFEGISSERIYFYICFIV